ncbi:MAG: hypothetical protein Tp1137MES00d2C23059491_43 [Prokaryotic dsDNA virus sp.]|nr:MAG: hypothetical protein Tp1137MES00d2C23059491_43 [Prokaryotic dsDNA virus sp.]|tara:strand:- start:10910 stop:11101 length:192 start_codon:yes stop_codon:yes gene_type:complete
MPRYSVNIAGNVVKLNANSEQEAKLKAFRLSPYYSDLKRLESRWWLLVYPVLFLLGWYGVSLL